MDEYLIANTTKTQRIELVRSWIPTDEAMDDAGDMDLFVLYADYINGEKEISECNAAFRAEDYADTAGSKLGG